MEELTDAKSSALFHYWSFVAEGRLIDAVISF